MHAFARPLAIALLALAPQPPALAGGGTCAPVVEAGWLRQPPVAMPMLGGFARISNPCTHATKVVAAHSPAFARVELHETRVVDGVSRMRAVASLDLPAGAGVELRPGGLHLMLMDPVAPLAPGERVRVEFELDDGRRVGAGFEVRAAGQR